MWRRPHRSTNGSNSTSEVARTKANLKRASGPFRDTGRHLWRRMWPTLSNA